MIRAFVAIDLPATARAALEVASADLRRLDLAGRCVNPGSIHLTLKFLGPTDPQRIEAVELALADAARRFTPFELRLQRMGVFPNPSRPKVVWIGISHSEPLIQLQKQVEENLAEAGFEPQGRPFKPHLTLMRIKSAKNVPCLARYLAKNGPTADGGSFKVERFHLYQSVLRPSGAEYRKLATFELPSSS